MELIIFIIFLSSGYFLGSRAEKRHYKSIQKREKEFLNLPAITFKTPANPNDMTEGRLVKGSVVISTDYFKRILAGLRNIFGGEMSSYESLVDRARREATLRMKEKAKGADMILNVRVETSAIGRNADKRKSIASVEAIAYGTAVKFTNLSL